LINGKDVSRDIRLPEVGNAASPVSAVAEVRSLLVAMQQELAARRPVVMDGRDIGTVVLPDAACKVFLTASTRVRARRRANELLQKGMTVDIDQVEREIIERDERDSTRAASPLRQAEDAVLVDSSDMGIEEVVCRIIELAEGQTS
jgi:cytidylate kinase